MIKIQYNIMIFGIDKNNNNFKLMNIFIIIIMKIIKYKIQKLI